MNSSSLVTIRVHLGTLPTSYGRRIGRRRNFSPPISKQPNNEQRNHHEKQGGNEALCNVNGAPIGHANQEAPPGYNLFHESPYAIANSITSISFWTSGGIPGTGVTNHRSAYENDEVGMLPEDRPYPVWTQPGRLLR